MSVLKSTIELKLTLGLMTLFALFGTLYYFGILGAQVMSPIFSLSLAILAAWGLLLIKRKILTLAEKRKRRAAIITFSINLLFGVALFVLLIPVLNEFGVPTSSLVTILGTSTLAVGLALKDFLGNIAAGIMLIFQKPFDHGDLVEIGGKLGRVDRIDLFSVRIKTPENEMVYFPNGKLITDMIINKATQGTRRMECLVEVSYDADLKLAKQVIANIAAQDPRILKEPAPLVAVNNLADHGVELTVRVWVLVNDFVPVRFDLLESIKLGFDEQGIVIPFPHLNVMMKPN